MAKTTLSTLMALVLLVALVSHPRVTTAEGYDWAVIVAAEEAAQAAENETAQEAAETLVHIRSAPFAIFTNDTF